MRSMKTEYKISDWLPVSVKEVKQRGWEQLDVILVSGDAYVDHPAFGAAVIGRILEQMGLRTAVLSQPNWQDDLRDFKKLGRPRLFFGVTSGNMDSMVNHYTALKRRRSTDAYTPGGEAGFRPVYAAAVYSKILKEIYPDVPVIMGGIEASLRRVTHYDYWSDQLKPSILFDSGADLLLYGMAEQPLREAVKLLEKGVPFSSLKTIPQTAFFQPAEDDLPKNKHWQTVELASHQSCLKNKKKFSENFKIVEKESNSIHARRIIQKNGDRMLVVNPQFPPMDSKTLDASFDLSFTRMPHPRYKKRGAIPAYEMIRHSINIHRGCFGGCSFCTISAHQGKFIASRSEASIKEELDAVTKMPDFKGYISDIGGPSANMYKMQGKDLSICEACKKASCIFPTVCFNLDTDHKPMTALYRMVSSHPEIKKAFVSSGIRYDLFLGPEKDKGYGEYIEQLVRCHVSGRLKIAPEHSADSVLKIMRKPSFSLFYAFKDKFEAVNKKYGLKQFLVPYFISSHPGSELQDMAELAAVTKELGFRLEQVQDFTPTPMTVAAVIFYSGYHPYTLEKVYTAKKLEDKRKQNSFFFWYKTKSRKWMRQVLKNLNRQDLIERLLG